MGAVVRGVGRVAWFMRMCAAAILGHALITIDPLYPTVSPEVRLQHAAARADLVSEG